MEAEKMIKITPEIRVELLKEFPVSEKTVYNALTFATGGYTAESIRRRAQELGGKLMKEAKDTTEGTAQGKAFCPDCTMVNYPCCSKGIPCCKCDEESCNSRQSCPKGERKEDAA